MAADNEPQKVTGYDARPLILRGRSYFWPFFPLLWGFIYQAAAVRVRSREFMSMNTCKTKSRKRKRRFRLFSISVS
jgi:hypothetical protein